MTNIGDKKSVSRINNNINLCSPFESSGLAGLMVLDTVKSSAFSSLVEWSGARGGWCAWWEWWEWWGWGAAGARPAASTRECTPARSDSDTTCTPPSDPPTSMRSPSVPSTDMLFNLILDQL